MHVNNWYAYTCTPIYIYMHIHAHVHVKSSDICKFMSRKINIHLNIYTYNNE